MKIDIVLQVVTIIFQYKSVRAIYGFGDEPEDPKRIRIFLEDDEKLLVPKNSKVEYINPIIDMDQEIILDKPPTFSTYVSRVAKKPIYLPNQPYFVNQIPAGFFGRPSISLEELRIKTDYIQPEATNFVGGGYGHHGYGHVPPISAGANQQQQQLPVSFGKLLRPVLLLPNGWIHGVDVSGYGADTKPVTEDRPDDLKYDFRTQTHSIR